MKAILLAAGHGTRLRPLTNTIPKCLVPINGQPLLDIWLQNLVNSGVNEILINTHYLAERVYDYISKSKFKEFVLLKEEKELLGTAGTLLKNISFLDNEGGLLIHADNLCLSNLNNFYNSHYNRPSECIMTMMTFITENPSNCGVVGIDERGIVKEFYEKIENPPTNIANGAIYFLSKEFLNRLKKMKNLNDFSLDIIPKFIGKIYTSKSDGVLIDIGTSEAYKKANKIISKYSS